ncbi:MAG TPA: glucosidase, partial [Verrucomicrobiae bacterium]|nr:glucosidase [Verrucomicrobiae bacterium]
MNPEKQRLADGRTGKKKWKLFGPYLSERQWGTVREDYSAEGTAWEYFPHEHARSRAYRWGEDGIAGFSDDQARLCLSLALWNGKDPILKERLFGLTNPQGNHGEDVKELYYYLDATPTHSYQKMLYKYPQREFPYASLVEENARRKSDPRQMEYELLDTGIFDDDRYFDVFTEYAKADVDDVLMRVTVYNRGPEAAMIHVMPQLWFRNTWSWDNSAKPAISLANDEVVTADHAQLGVYNLYADGKPEVIFCDNETNVRRLYGQNEAAGFFKDAFDDYVVHGNQAAVNPERNGTKAGLLYKLTVPAGGSVSVRLRLSKASNGKAFADFEAIFKQRIQEADGFYGELQSDIEGADERNVQRQAFAGMMWSKQFFYYDVREWLKGDPAQPPPPAERKTGRNADWTHLNNADIISMPDKWEFPWYASWDLAFHTIPLALLDAGFAKKQLSLLLHEWYMHPNGQLPAYEWNFSNVNPPVHAWASWRVFQIDRKQRREADPNDAGDIEFLQKVYHKLLLNFTWWVNRKDSDGRNIFQGGFLGLDNIGVFDRNEQLPDGGHINQADGTSWMAMYCLNMLRIALELAQTNKVYEDIATKFFEHFLGIAAAINSEDGLGLWDDTDEFYYDELRTSGGRELTLRLRSMVGLIPLFAVEVLEPAMLKKLPGFTARLEWYLNHRPDLAMLVSRWQEPGSGERRLLSMLRGHRMKCLLHRMLDETEFLSDHGVRSLSKVYEREPYSLQCGGLLHEVVYWPGESQSGVFGGNSNWRGPVWMPANYLIIESLQKFHHYYGDDFKIECPTGSGKFITIGGVAEELARRLAKLFLKGADGQRPVLKYHPKLATDPHFKDYVLFHE